MTLRIKYCRSCTVPLDESHGKRVYCFICRPIFDRYTATIGSLGRYSKSRISKDAIKTCAEARVPKICSRCNFSLHVEVCHVKSVSSFPKDTLLSVVNDINNLIVLCPNCHWKFDNLPRY